GKVDMGFLDMFRRRRRRQLPVEAQHSSPPSFEASGGLDTPAVQPHFAVIDVETTGLSSRSDRIIEIAVVSTDPWGHVLSEWSTRLNPQGPVGATHIHGITAADVATSPTFEALAAVIAQQLAGAAIVAHNARFDLAFLRAEYQRAGWAMP